MSILPDFEGVERPNSFNAKMYGYTNNVMNEFPWYEYSEINLNDGDYIADQAATGINENITPLKLKLPVVEGRNNMYVKISETGKPDVEFVYSIFRPPALGYLYKFNTYSQDPFEFRQCFGDCSGDSNANKFYKMQIYPPWDWNREAVMRVVVPSTASKLFLATKWDDLSNRKLAWRVQKTNKFHSSHLLSTHDDTIFDTIGTDTGGVMEFRSVPSSGNKASITLDGSRNTNAWRDDSYTEGDEPGIGTWNTEGGANAHYDLGDSDELYLYMKPWKQSAYWRFNGYVGIQRY